MGFLLKVRHIALFSKEIFTRTFSKLGNLDTADSLDKINETGLSLARFGDGEFNIILGESIPYQNADRLLAVELREILANDNSNLLVGVPHSFFSLKGLTFSSKKFWLIYMAKKRESIMPLLSTEHLYIDSQISRFYINRSNKAESSIFLNKLQQIWKNKNIVIIEGRNSRFGAGNTLFGETKSVRRIVTLEKNAYSKIDKLIQVSLDVQDVDVFILALGPTATVLAARLSEKGLRAIDLGNMDMEYEWMIRNVKSPIAIQGKYTMEAEGGENVDSVEDETYQSQIIAMVL